MDSSSSKTTLDSTKTNPDASFSTDLQEDLFQDLFSDMFSTTTMMIQEPSMEGVQNVVHESEITLSPLNPAATMNENEMFVDYVPSPSHSLDMSDYEDLVAKLCNADIDDFQLGENIFQDYPFQDNPIPLDDDISVEGLSGIGDIASPSAVRASVGYNASVGGIAFSNVNAIATTDSGVGGTASSNVNAIAATDSSVGGIAFPNVNAIAATDSGVGGIAFPNVNAIAATDSGVGGIAFPNVNAIAATDSGVGGIAFPNVNAIAATDSSVGGIAFSNVNPIAATYSSVGGFAFPNVNPIAATDFGIGGIAFPNVNAIAATESSVVAGKQVVGPSTFGGGGSSSQQQFQMTGINSLGLPATMPQYNSSRSNQRFFWLRPPPLSDLPKFVPAWEGTLVGIIHPYRQFIGQARAMRKPTSYVALNVQWCCRLEISVFLPTTSVNYTMKFCGGPIDYLFFNIIQFNNLDLYDHLSKNNMCAKVVLPSHVIILSTTNSIYHFLGTIFPRETVFVEPTP